jgi:autotransporter-associated beta strand protein
VLSLNMNGTGVVTLAGNNTYHGGTTVTAGTLLVNNVAGSGTGYGDVTVQSGAMLGGRGILAPGAGHDITINSGATLMVGTPGSTSAQTLSVALQSSGATPGTQSVFTLSSGSTLHLDLFLNQVSTPTTESDRLVFSTSGAATSSISIGGATLNVGIGASSALNPANFSVGDTWKLIDWGGVTPTGTFSFTNLNGSYTSDFTDLPNLGAGKFWDISQLYTLGNIIVAVPEPGRLLLLLLGFLALGWQRRRRRNVAE